MQAQPEKKRHRFKMPSAFTILFIIIIIIAVLSWFIPAGKYSTDSSGNLIANTYHTVKSNPQGLWDVVMSPVYGMVGDKNTDGAISVSLFILVIGGFWASSTRPRRWTPGSRQSSTATRGAKRS